MPCYQRLTDSVLNRRSPELWRSEAAENEFRSSPAAIKSSGFYAKARRYWASLLTRQPAENVGLGRPGGARGIRTADTVLRNFPLKCRENFGRQADQILNRECRTCELRKLGGTPEHLQSSGSVLVTEFFLPPRGSSCTNGSQTTCYSERTCARLFFSTAAAERGADIMTRTSGVSYGPISD